MLTKTGTLIPHGQPVVIDVQVVQLVRQGSFQQVALGLLYHISQDDRHKSMFIYTEAVTMMLDLLMHVEDLTTTPELIALAVNLTQNDRIAEVRLLMLLLCLSIFGYVFSFILRQSVFSQFLIVQFCLV